VSTSAAPPTGADAHAADQRTLVCDDTGTVRALRVVLRDAGFRVEASSSASEALDAAALRLPAAAITELALPDADGVDSRRGVREWSASLLLHVWGPGHVHDAQLLRAHIANLRRKFASPHIRMMRGVGHRFEEPQPRVAVIPEQAGRRHTFRASEPPSSGRRRDARS
jgi:DNA-binding response OmpR family regulator